MQNYFTLSQAAKICHRSKSSILEAIRSGRLSAKMNDKKQWQIEASELHRVYPFLVEEPLTEQEKTVKNHIGVQNTILLDLLDKEKEERERERNQLLLNIEDLKQRLTSSELERRSTQEKLTLLLTHQPLATESTNKASNQISLWKKIFKR
jgi:hypothetical protein